MIIYDNIKIHLKKISECTWTKLARDTIPWKISVIVVMNRSC